MPIARYVFFFSKLKKFICPCWNHVIVEIFFKKNFMYKLSRGEGLWDHTHLANYCRMIVENWLMLNLCSLIFLHPFFSKNEFLWGSFFFIEKENRETKIWELILATYFGIKNEKHWPESQTLNNIGQYHKFWRKLKKMSK
jgi:hypothetical protein